LRLELTFIIEIIIIVIITFISGAKPIANIISKQRQRRKQLKTHQSIKIYESDEYPSR